MISDLSGGMLTGHGEEHALFEVVPVPETEYMKIRISAAFKEKCGSHQGLAAVTEASGVLLMATGSRIGEMAKVGDAIDRRRVPGKMS